MRWPRQSDGKRQPASLRDDNSGDRGMLLRRKKRRASKAAALLRSLTVLSLPFRSRPKMPLIYRRRLLHSF